jgi:hypothetical protein
LQFSDGFEISCMKIVGQTRLAINHLLILSLDIYIELETLGTLQLQQQVFLVIQTDDAHLLVSGLRCFYPFALQQDFNGVQANFRRGTWMSYQRCHLCLGLVYAVQATECFEAQKACACVIGYVAKDGNGLESSLVTLFAGGCDMACSKVPKSGENNEFNLDITSRSHQKEQWFLKSNDSMALSMKRGSRRFKNRLQL